MTKTMKLAAFAALLSAAAPALAASDVLVVDLDRVMSESAAAKSGTTQLKAKYDAPIQARRSALQTAAQAYQSQVQSARAAAKPGVPVPAATQTAVQQTGERAQAAQDSLQQLGQELTGVEGYVRQQIIEHITPIAEQIRNERKATVVIPKGSLFASDPAADVTGVLLQRLDQQFPTPSITPPQQAPATGGR